MRFLGLMKADADSEAGVPPSMELMQKMGAFMEEVTKAGVLAGTDGLKPSREGKRVKLADGKIPSSMVRSRNRRNSSPPTRSST